MDAVAASQVDEIILTGRPVPPEPARLARAGSMELELHGTDVRRVAWRGVEVVNQVYVAIRDEPWNSLPGRLEDLRFDELDGPGFAFQYRTRHEFPYLGVDLRCEGSVSGDAGDTLSVGVVVTALQPITYNRIGLNVLHGARTHAGRPYRAALGDVAWAGELPTLVGPQAYHGDRLTGLFSPFDHLELHPVEGVTVTFDFEGDEFEMEDQRNFGDATFKTYSTPLQRPAPFQLAAGESVRQRVVIRVRDERSPRPARVAPREGPTIVRLGEASDRHVPPIGLGQAEDELPLSDAESQRVAALRPQHIRVELDVATGGAACQSRLDAAAAAARALSSALWVDVRCALNDAETLAVVVEAACTADPAPERLYLATTAPEPPDVGGSRELLGLTRTIAADASPTTAVGVGSQQFFADLNRAPFDPDVVQSLTFATSPTVHRHDDETVLENAELVGDAVPAARRWLGQRPLTVGPVSLAAPHGPFPAGPRSAGDLPERVDTRQVSLFLAAWTIGELASLAHAGVDGLTFFQTVGWMGVTERDSGSASPDRFPSRAADVFPVWHVLADVAEWRGAELIETQLEPRPVFGAPMAMLAVRDQNGIHLLIGSLRREPQHVRVVGLPNRTDLAARVRTLDAASASDAMARPDRFRASAHSATIGDGTIELELGPYATVRLDLQPRTAA